MKRFLKWFGIALGVMAVGVATLAVVVPKVLSTDTLKPMIEEKAYEATGRKVTIAGPIGVSVFPWVGFSLTDFTMENAKGFSADVFAHIEECDVQVKLLPLLRKNIEIRRFYVKEMVLNLERHKNGDANWIFTPIEPEDEDEEPTDLNKILMGFSAKGIQIEQSHISLKDAMKDMAVSLSPFSVEFRDIRMLSKDNLVTGFHAKKMYVQPDSSLYQHGDMTVKLTGMDALWEGVNVESDLANEISFTAKKGHIEGTNIMYATNEMKLQLDKIALDVEVPAVALGEKEQRLSLGSFTVRHELFLFETADSQIRGKELNGKIEKFSAVSSSGKLGLVEVKKIDLRQKEFAQTDKELDATTQLTDIAIALHDVTSKKPVELAISAKMNDTPVTITGKMGPVPKKDGLNGRMPFNIRVKGGNMVSVTIEGTVDKLLEERIVDVDLNVPTFSLRNVYKTMLKKPFPIRTVDIKTFESVAFSGHIKGQKDALRITNAKIKLDQTNATATLALAPKSIQARVVADRLNMDRYMAPSEDEKKKAAKWKKELGDTKDGNYDLLREITLDASVKIDTLQVIDIAVQNIDFRLKGNKGVFNASPVDFSIYGGRGKARAEIDVREDMPKITVHFTGTGFNVASFLKGLLEKELFTGKADIQLEVSVVGDTKDDIFRSLNGAMDLNVRNGVFRNEHLPWVRPVVNLLVGKTAGTGKELQFTRMHVPCTFQNGIATTTNTIVTSDLFSAKAVGTVNLPRESLNLLVTTTGVGQYVAVRVEGPFGNPKISPEMTAKAKEEAVRAVKNIIDAPKDSKPAESVKEGLKGIFKR